MRRTPALLPVLALSLAALAPGARAENPLVRFATPLGDFDLELCAAPSARCLGAAPNTVANFLGYVDADAYQGSFAHRSVPGFVIQGGSYFVGGSQIDLIATGPPVASEFNQSNLRGTVSVPLLSNGPTPCDTNENSGTSGWFVNLADNGSLDCGLFAVFGVVVEPGMTVVDAIAALPRFNAGATTPFTQLPLKDYPGCPAPPDCPSALPYLVYTGITRVPEPDAGAGALAAAGALALAAARRLRS
jgi:cyclophilin family peptidyl-prolyl cis-trans isomerase